MIPLSARTRNAPGTPKQFKMLLTVFTVRHLMGVGLFAWLNWQAVRAGGTVWVVMAVASVAYIAFVVGAWLRLRGQYVRSLRKAMAAAEGQPS